MPRNGVALILRPLFDKATEYGHYYMGRAAAYASRSMFVRNIGAADATRANFEGSLDADDPIYCYLLGHGNSDTYTAQNQEVVMRTCSGNEALIGRVVLLLSCSCGIRIAPDAVNKGALAIFGWAVDFTWVAVTEPEFDQYARGFFEAVNAISNALADGRTTKEAMDASIATWNKWIDQWSVSDDPYAPMIIQNMVHDREGQRLFGDENVRITTGIAPPIVAGLPIELPYLFGQTLTMLGLIAL